MRINITAVCTMSNLNMKGQQQMKNSPKHKMNNTLTGAGAIAQPIHPPYYYRVACSSNKAITYFN
jgi:hypothetical protein